MYFENSHVVGLDPADPIKVSYAKKIGTDPTGAENPELLKLKHTHGHDMTIVNGVGRIGWMTGGKAARWRDEDMADTFTAKAIGFLEKHGELVVKPSRGEQGWGITIGDAQYHWFKTTLERSKTKYKFVFAHHVLGGDLAGPFVAGHLAVVAR